MCVSFGIRLEVGSKWTAKVARERMKSEGRLLVRGSLRTANHC